MRLRVYRELPSRGKLRGSRDEPMLDLIHRDFLLQFRPPTDQPVKDEELDPELLELSGSVGI
jgi:hypothetical protein